jgi:hypothetical protein
MMDCKEMEERRAFALSFREIRYKEVLGETGRSFALNASGEYGLVLATG